MKNRRASCGPTCADDRARHLCTPGQGCAQGPLEHRHLRIEDDAPVTAKGCELMTRGVPVKADEIEALMWG